MINYVKKIIAGIVIGIANVVPGVSGGTIAVVFNVYSELISVAAFNITKIKEQWKSLSCLLGGMAIGIFIFARVFKILYEKFPVQTNFFFVGLIIASCVILFENLRMGKAGKKSEFAVNFFLFLLGISIMVSVYLFKGMGVNKTNTIDVISVKNFFVLFFAGIVSAAAMIIPGISGSFILLIMGVYYPIIKAVNDFNFPVLISVGLGIVVGIFLAARLIKFLLEKYPKQTYAFILGLVAGSILHVFPQVCQPLKMRFISALCLLSGYVLITIFERRR